MTLTFRPGYHHCPRKGCSEQVSNDRYACLKDWRELSSTTQREIVRTRRLGVLHLERRAAFRMAEEDWDLAR